jgi:integrase
MLKICLNPNCNEQFETGHYGDRQKICSSDECIRWYKMYWSQTAQPPRGIPDPAFELIVQHTENDVLHNSMIIVARHTGLRKGELLGLIWSDLIDHDEVLLESVSIMRQWSDAQRRFIPTKTKQSRMGFFLEEAQDALVRLHDWATPERHDRVFPITGTGIYKWFIRAQNQLDVVNPRTGHPYRFHDLRHALATELVRGGRIDLAQKMLGHKNIATTMRYSQQSAEDIIKDVKGIRERD